MNVPSSSSDTSRRSQLNAIKLKALVSEHLGPSAPPLVDVETFPNGAAALADGTAWVLADGPAERSLGRALVWAVRRSAERLHVIAESGTGVLARRAAGFSLPTSVWFAEGRSLLPAPPAPLADPPLVSSDHESLRQMIIDAGAAPHAEHGVLFGEVRGLEVCRVVDSPTTGFLGELSDLAAASGMTADADSGVRLEVGVGSADREAFQMLHGEIPTVEALAGVVSAVARHRSVGSLQHPLNRLGAERFLRWQAEQDPASVGCASLVPGEPPVPRPNLKDPVPCVADGVRVDGDPVRVVFSSGVDLDLLPYVVDVQLAASRRPSSTPDEGSGDVTPVVLAMPERDVLPVVRELAGLLKRPVEIVELGSPVDQ